MAFENGSMLLSGSRASALYREVAAPLPLIGRITRRTLCALLQNEVIQTPAQLWLQDLCRQGLMRRAGVEEHFVTGAGSDFEKFRAFAHVMQDTAASNAKLQCHAELQMLFDCQLLLCETHCIEIWQKMSSRLVDGRITLRTLCEAAQCEALLCVCTPEDDLADFAKVGEAIPVFCPDAFLAPQGKGFAEAVRALCGEQCGFFDLTKALVQSVERFAKAGCRAAVHSVFLQEFCRPDEYHATQSFEKAMRGERLSEQESAMYAAQIWRVLGREYVRHGMLLELACGGVHPLSCDEKKDTVPSNIVVSSLRELFDYLQRCDGLPRVVFYVSSAKEARDLTALGAHYPALNEGEPRCSFGILQGGPGENRERIRALANLIPLSLFVGAMTDAREPVSVVDGAILRRTLCSLIAEWEEYGELEMGEERIRKLLRGMCYENAKRIYHI